MSTQNIDHLPSLQKKLGYLFKTPALLERALTHRSYDQAHNERLEFLGDAILSFVIAEILYEKFPKATEGELSTWRARLVKGKTLAEIASEFDLGHCLRLGPGELKTKGFNRPSMLADALEAVIGALYLDADIAICHACLAQWFASRIERVQQQTLEKDPKTQLQEYLQGQCLALPLYEIISTDGASHNQIFTVSCQVQALPHKTWGKARNRRAAEQQAAAAYLLQLQEHDA